MPARARAHRSSSVSGQRSPKTTTPTPHSTVATCSRMLQGQRSARNPPLGR
jgi:hypothetical protein